MPQADGLGPAAWGRDGGRQEDVVSTKGKRGCCREDPWSKEASSPWQADGRLDGAAAAGAGCLDQALLAFKDYAPGTHLSRYSMCGVAGSSSPSAVSSCGTTAGGSWFTTRGTWARGVLQKDRGGRGRWGGRVRMCTNPAHVHCRTWCGMHDRSWGSTPLRHACCCWGPQRCAVTAAAHLTSAPRAAPAWGR